MKIRLGVNDTINEMLIGHLFAPLETPKTTKVKKVVRRVSPDQQKIEEAKQERQEKVEEIKIAHQEERLENTMALQLKEAIVMSEIIGKPRCKTRRRKR